MNRLNYIIKRLLIMIPVLFLVMVIIFTLVRFIPGNPAEVMLGSRATPESLAAMEARLGLDQPILKQFWIFFKNTLRLDLGESIATGKPVSGMISEKFAVTASLTVVTAVFTLLITLPLGYFSGMKKNKLAGKIINTMSLIVLAVPSFWVGIILMYILGINLHLFPITGWGNTFVEHIHALILPAFTQSIAISALMIRNMQGEVAEIAASDYVDFAYSKGLSQRRIKTHYIIRNVLISTVTIFSIGIASMLGGSVTIETVFSLPGLGSMMINSIMSRDYPVVQGCIIVFAMIILIVNLITDVLYSIIDPRVDLK